MSSVPNQPDQFSLFGREAPALTQREQELVHAYTILDRPLDDLPYTPSFEQHILGLQSPIESSQREQAREALHILQRLRKSGRLPRVGGRSGGFVALLSEEQQILLSHVLREIETLGQRDRLPYTDAFERIAERFNAETGKNHDHHTIWRMIARLAK